MRKINYQDLQLDIEKKFATEIDKDAKSAFFDYDDLSVINYQEEKHFHNLIIDTIQIKGHYLVDAITNRIKNKLRLIFKNIPTILIVANFFALFKNLSFAKIIDDKTSSAKMKIKKTI